MPDRTLPPTIKLLAEHLDSALAAGEDLTVLSFEPRGMCATGVACDVEPPSLTRFVVRVQRLEQALALRVFSARDRADDLGAESAHFGPIVRLFLGGTAELVDAVEALAQPGGDPFHLCDCPVAYLKSRGVLSEACSGPSGFETIAITETFRIAGLIELGPLLDLISSFLDALEVHHDVFPQARQPSEPPALPAPAGPFDSLGAAIAELRSRA